MIYHRLYTFSRSIFNKFVSLIELQLFLSCWAVAILMCWGLPFSLLSPLAMIILMPFLTLFLMLSSLIFFTQLVCIPNQYLITLLEYVSSTWIYLLNGGSKMFLIAYPCYGYSIALIVPLSSIFILFKVKRPDIRCVAFSFLLACSSLFSYWLVPNQSSFTCKGTYRSITVSKSNNDIQLIDPGAAGFRQAESFVHYTVATEYRKNFGMQSIDEYIIKKPNGCTFKTALEAIEHLSIKTIHIPYWDEPGTQAQRRWYMHLKNRCEKEGIAIKRYKKS